MRKNRTLRVGILKNARWGLLLGVLLIVITTGCMGGGTGAEEIRTGSVEAMEDVDTYAFDTTEDLEARPGGRSTEGDLSMTAFVRGTASESAGRMKTSSNLVVNEETIDQETLFRAPNSSAEEMDTYVRLRNVGEEDSSRWFEMEDGATSSTPVEAHIRLLEASGAEYEGEETIEGESAHVLSMDADTEEYRGFAVRKAESLMSRVGIPTHEQELFDDAEVENASLRYWISDDTDRILRVESTANVSATVPDAEDEVEITVESETSFSSYGGEVDTAAPEGIENAGEFEGMFSGESASSSERVSEGEGGTAESYAYAGDSGVVDVLEVRAQESGGTETRTARVITNPIDANRVTAKAVESGDSASAEPLNTSRQELELELDPDGDEVVVTVTRGNETEVVYNETVP